MLLTSVETIPRFELVSGIEVLNENLNNSLSFEPIELGVERCVDARTCEDGGAIRGAGAAYGRAIAGRLSGLAEVQGGYVHDDCAFNANLETVVRLIAEKDQRFLAIFRELNLVAGYDNDAAIRASNWLSSAAHNLLHPEDNDNVREVSDNVLNSPDSTREVLPGRRAEPFAYVLDARRHAEAVRVVAPKAGVLGVRGSVYFSNAASCVESAHGRNSDEGHSQRAVEAATAALISGRHSKIGVVILGGSSSDPSAWSLRDLPQLATR